MKIDIKKILLVLLLSSAVGLLFNFINPSGIPLIKEEKQLEFVSDSILIPKNDAEIEGRIDSVDITAQPNNIDENQKLIEQPIDTIKEETLSPQIIVEEQKESVIEPKAIKVEQAYNLFNDGATFLDARDSTDYNSGHILNSINLPYYSFEENEYKLIDISKNEIIVTYCNGTDCDLSVMLANKLSDLGYKNVYIFYGGWWDWLEKKYPVKTN